MTQMLTQKERALGINNMDMADNLFVRKIYFY